MVMCDRKIGPFQCCSVVQGDCLELMKQLPDGCVDAVITDPPYGIGNFVQCTGNIRGEAVMWNDRPPCPEVFAEIRRISKFRVIWGANYFNCFEGAGAFVWDKNQPMENFSQAEIASVSWGKKVDQIRLTWTNYVNTKCSNHPCERPVALYTWCISKVPQQPQTILDVFCGSGSTLVAAKKLGRHFLGFEISEAYCQIARERLARIDAQPNLFAPKPEQGEMF